ncbi:MAG: CotH kinase family protein [Bacteroidetes bacterium]|nr:CotH kinase family protein [Bacteroidota bacterium]
MYVPRSTFRQRSAAVLLLLGMIVPLQAQDPGDVIFAGITVHSIAIQMNQPNYWDSLVYYYNQGLEQYMVGTVTLNDTLVLDSVGVRLKGNSSFTHPNNKKSIRLSLDEYKSAYRWDGEKSIHLNNGWGDPSFMREKMHLDFLRDAGIAAPRSNYAFVKINGAAWGLYSMVEHVDKTFLTDRYGDKTGNLYKAVDGFGPGANYFSDFRYYGTAVDSYAVRYELKTEESLTPWNDLIGVIGSVNNSAAPAAAIPSAVNLRNFVRTMAADNLFANLDAYINSARNFYVYFLPATGKMEWIVWDTGLSFGAYAPSLSNLDQLSITYVSNATTRPLLGKVLNTPYLRNEYLKAYSTLFTQHFSVARLQARADSIAAVIRPFVSADPKKMYTSQQFESNLVGSIIAAGGAGSTKPGIKSFLQARETSVKQQLAAAVIDWTNRISAGDVVINEFAAQNDSILDPAGEAEDWIELYNTTANDIDLGGIRLSDSYANPAKWSFPNGTTIPAKGYLVIWADEDTGQAGLHALIKLSAGGEQLLLSNPDSTVIDSLTFGAQALNRTMSRVPNGTGPFYTSLPTPGAVNIGVIPVAKGEVVINEFAADNDSLTDPAGEAEDWIELYNTASRTIDLGGMFLSDDYLTPAKWKFPAGTTIPANGYLVVWADEDSGQAGVHAKFKLSKSGERIVLSGTDTTAMDTVAFGAQTTNRTMARIPNGTGPFVQGIPTLGVNNEPSSLLPGEVVINEFLASNTLILDPAGEAEDWVELYNTTTRVIDLGGVSLSDNYDLPAKWSFSAGTSIAPKGYLLVWCDEDSGQAGIHAMIKLSASGEEIMLSSANGTVIDSVTFGAQTANMSMARIPDGSGPFKQVVPTPAAENKDVQVSVSGAAAAVPTEYALLQNHPNPFNPNTTITYQLPRASAVRLTVYDIIGKEIAVLVNDARSAGTHTVSFDASRLSSGIYLYRISAGGYVQTRRMMLIK